MVAGLSRLLIYILGHRPDEFGLVPDSDGFVTYKELIQAIHEEQGWRYVGKADINEALLGRDRHLFQSDNKRIAVVEKKWCIDVEPHSLSLPGILFAAVRTKAHPVVMERGLVSVEGRYVVLSPDRGMALRIGRRRDPKPVLLEIMAVAAQSKGVDFYPFGDLFLSRQVASEFISGPPVLKETMERRSMAETKKEKNRPEPVHLDTGSFTPDISRDPDPLRRFKGKKRRGWKEEARKIRRGKKH